MATLAMVAGALGGGCSSVGNVASFEGPFVSGVLVEDFSEAPLSFAAFDPQAQPAWRFGDTLLYGMQFEVGGKKTKRMMRLVALNDHDIPTLPATLTVQEREREINTMSVASGTPRDYTMTVRADGEPNRAFPSRIGLVQLAVLDEAGNRQSSRLVKIPVDLLAGGFNYYCSSNAEFIKRVDANGEYQKDDQENFDWRAMAALFAVVRMVQDEDILRQQLMELVTVADKMAALFSGFDFTLESHFESMTRTAPPPGIPVVGETWTLPATLTTGSREILHVQLIFTEPVPPLHLTGGLIAIRAVHAHNKSSRFELLLLGARTPPQ